MKLESSYFDSIRITPQKKKKRAKTAASSRASEKPATCEWTGCTMKASHKAPLGDAKGAGYIWYCLDHVQEHNKSYNYFEGMSEAEAQAHRAANAHGQRPTWRMGVNSDKAGAAKAEAGGPGSFHDPFELFNTRRAKTQASEDIRRRPARNAERKALEHLGLNETATLNEVKARYKELVKRFHPDANGGEKAAEDQLRRVIQAYDYLKKSGFC